MEELELKKILEMEQDIVTELDGVHVDCGGRDWGECRVTYIEEVRKAVKRINRKIKPFSLRERGMEYDDSAVMFTFALTLGDFEISKIKVSSVLNPCHGRGGLCVSTSSWIV